MGGKILVADDEKEIADLLEVYLQNDGYSVYKFYSGSEALRSIEENEIDLALLDVMLPDIDGFRLCQKIRERFYFPIIMLTAKMCIRDRLHISNQLCNKLTILNITPAQLTDLMVSGGAGVFLVYISATADKS